MNVLSINGARLWDSLMLLAEIGATPAGGVRRLALTEEDRRGRDWLIEQGRAAGLVSSIDSVGNIFLRREGQQDLPPIVIGSHIDSQPSGGKFDGTFGVLAGLEVCRTLSDAGFATAHPIEVVAWTNEEGSRFLPVMAGSGAFAGVHSADDLLTSIGNDGVCFAEALDAIGYRGGAKLGGRAFEAYPEAHIEQGPVLDSADMEIGCDTGALGQAWFNVELTGVECHAGPTPMAMRRDAMQGAAEIAIGVDHIGRTHPDARSTIGSISLWPNSRNVVPGRAIFSVDLRHPQEEGLTQMVAAFQTLIKTVCKERELTFTIESTARWAPLQFDADLIERVTQAAKNRSYHHQAIVSGAGHDAVHIAKLCPTTMIFIPCRDGLSHNEAEYAEPQHVEKGANVLLDCVLGLARKGTE